MITADLTLAHCLDVIAGHAMICHVIPEKQKNKCYILATSLTITIKSQFYSQY